MTVEFILVDEAWLSLDRPHESRKACYYLNEILPDNSLRTATERRTS